MKQALLILSFFVGNLLFGQDYLIVERFDPDTYSDSASTSSQNYRIKNSWGLNTNLGEDDILVNEWGSNLIALSFKYDQPLYKGIHWSIGAAYLWDNYRLHARSDMMLQDSVRHKKVKLRIQSISLETGFRFQTSDDFFSNYFLEVTGYLNTKTYSKYLTWDEAGDMDLKSSTSNLSYVNPFHYGVEARVGYAMVSVYTRYRLSDLFDSNSGYREVPRIAIGLSLELGDF
jgi:hypothetical protein